MPLAQEPPFAASAATRSACILEDATMPHATCVLVTILQRPRDRVVSLRVCVHRCSIENFIQAVEPIERLGRHYCRQHGQLGRQTHRSSAREPDVRETMRTPAGVGLKSARAILNCNTAALRFVRMLTATLTWSS